MTRKEHDIIYRVNGTGATEGNGAAPAGEEKASYPGSSAAHSFTFLPAGLPPAVAAAIAEVMARVRSLPRTELNGHAGYRFANIDAFLAAVGPLCAEAGLIVVQDEAAAELVDLGGRAWLRLAYVFHLAHRSGALWERPLRRTILHRMDGAQAFGSAQSYALKQFMRALFQIPTGDLEDADYQPKEEVPGAAVSHRQFDRQTPSNTRFRRARTSRAGLPADNDREGARLEMIHGPDGQPKAGTWTRAAVERLIRLPTGEARRLWLDAHTDELERVRAVNPEYAAGIERTAATGERPTTKARAASPPASEPPAGPAAADADWRRLEAVLAELAGCAGIGDRDTILDDAEPLVSDIVETRPDLKQPWLDRLFELNRRFAAAPASAPASAAARH
jgi:hypothetical protein